MKIVRDTIITIVGKLGFAVSFFLFQMLIVKSISTTLFGEFGVWLIILEYVVIIFGMGLNVSLMFFSKKTNINGESYNLLNIFWYLIISIFSVLVIFLLDMNKENIIHWWMNIFSVYSINFTFKKEFINLFDINRDLCFSLVLAAFSMVSIYSTISCYHVKENFFIANLNVLGLGAVISIYGIVVYIFFNHRMTKELLVISYSFVLFLYFIVVVFLLYIKRDTCIHNLFTSINKKYFIYGLKSVILNALSKTLLIIDIAIVSIYASKIQVAYYIVASTVVKVSWLLVDSMGQVIFPKLISAKNNMDATLSKISQLSFILSLLILLIFYFIGELFLENIYSKEYRNSYHATMILIASNQGIVLYKLINKKLAAINKWKVIYIVLVISLFVNISLNFLLIPNYGINGAAFSSFISYWLCGLLLLTLTPINNKLDFFNIKSLIKHIFILYKKKRV